MNPSGGNYFEGFFTAEELDLSARFLRDGYVIVPADDRAALDRIRDAMVDAACEFLKIPAPPDAQVFLDTVHERVAIAQLNELRLHVIQHLNAHPWLRAAYFSTARRSLEIIVGNELAMQKRVNLSIQLPDDDSSLLPLHSDCWSGDSPFEAVLWIPFVDCFKTKSMFLLPPKPQAEFIENFGEFSRKSAEELFRAVEPQLMWLEIPYGSVLLFTHTLMHGNRVNVEGMTRWSTNCRFKSLFAPYWDKRLGEFFEPITVKAISRFGMSYKLPGGFSE
jgi:sporadic carbohydrate cluster 2OG-Fe(II) oxygenase